MLWTIGTSNRPLAEFLEELAKRNITRLIDVRSSPYSRLPWYNRTQMERWSERQGLIYQWEGAALGGRIEMPRDDPAFLTALERVIAASRHESAAIFCAEGDPAKCHRTWTVAASALAHDGIVAQSILRDGGEEAVTATFQRVPIWAKAQLGSLVQC